MPLDDHENHVRFRPISRTLEAAGGVKRNTKKKEISNTRSTQSDGVVRPSQRNDGHTHATCVLVDRYGYNKKITFVVLSWESRDV